ncbi:TetR family transcriptional regulator [Kitasatospora sp. NPDC096147]|uniref:TetR family transcriptional regulator n=1 Tax=Kitasatospora sp. NPDC096147 TaxID=3364093 RepID=UPI0038290365
MKSETDGPGQSASGPPGAPVPPRRRPVQQRSQERYERLLDACAALLDEVGAGALTTKETALRAGVPIGTLYQFFSGKESLLSALASRNLDLYLDRLGGRLGAQAHAAPLGVPEFVHLAVGEFVAMKRSVPGFGQLDFGLVEVLGAEPPTGGTDGAPGADPGGVDEGSVDDRHLLDTELDNNAAVAQRLQSLGGGLFSGPGHPLALRVALECADAVLKLAFRTDPHGDPALIAECERLLRCYLSDHRTATA